MTREDLDRLRDDQSEAYVAKIFKDNPNGMTVAPWCNSDFFDQAFCDGFNAAVKALWPELRRAQVSANVFGKEQHQLRDEKQKLQAQLAVVKDALYELYEVTLMDSGLEDWEINDSSSLGKARTAIRHLDSIQGGEE